jgi:hypothetical protein
MAKGDGFFAGNDPAHMGRLKGSGRGCSGRDHTSSIQRPAMLFRLFMGIAAKRSALRCPEPRRE